MFTLEELGVIQQALDTMTIQGTNARYLGALQSKVDENIKKYKLEQEKKQKGKEAILNSK